MTLRRYHLRKGRGIPADAVKELRVGGRETEQATFSRAHIVKNSLSLQQKRRKPSAEQPGRLFCHYHRPISKRRHFRYLGIGEPLLF